MATCAADCNATCTNSSTDTTPPGNPTSLTSTNTDTSITLSWGAATDNIGVTGYNISSGSTLIGSTTGITYTITGLLSVASYTYTVKAEDAAGNESSGSSITVTIPVPEGLVGVRAYLISNYGLQDSQIGYANEKVTVDGTPLNIAGLAHGGDGRVYATPANIDAAYAEYRIDTTTSLVDYLNYTGQDSSFSARYILATSLGIVNYTGTAAQNTAILEYLRDGISIPDSLKQPNQVATIQLFKYGTGESLIDNPVSIVLDVSGIDNAISMEANGWSPLIPGIADTEELLYKDNKVVKISSIDTTVHDFLISQGWSTQGTGYEVTFTYNGKTIKLINPNNNNSEDSYQSTGNTNTAVVIIGEQEVSDAMLRRDGTLVANISDMAFSLGGNLANGTRITDDYFEFEVYHPDTVTWSRKGYYRSDLLTNPSGGAPLISVQQLAADLGFSDKLTIATHSDGSKEAYIDKIDDGQDLFSSIASMILGFLPGVGDAKDIQEAVTGYDIITGQSLSAGDRCITVACAFLPIINGAAVRVGKKGLTKIDNLIEAADNLSDVERAAYRASLWNLRPTLRGLLLEKELARTEYNLATTGWYHIGAENSGFFPVIDFWRNNEVVSVKSIDPRLYDGDGATEKLLDYLNCLKCDILVEEQSISNINRTLDIRVPSGTKNLINLQVLLDDAEGIVIKIEEF